MIEGSHSLCLVVVVADDASDFPCAAFVLPQVDELRFANALSVVMSRVVKAMDADFDCSIALHGVHLQRAGNERAGHLAADIFLDGVG
jgi:hypothetical protein